MLRSHCIVELAGFSRHVPLARSNCTCRRRIRLAVHPLQAPGQATSAAIIEKPQQGLAEEFVGLDWQ